MAAYWLKADVQDTELISSRVTGSTSWLREDAEAEPPAGHRERLRPAVEEDRPLGHAVEVEDAVVIAVVPQRPVDLVAEDDQVVLDRDLGDRPSCSGVTRCRTGCAGS